MKDFLKTTLAAVIGTLLAVGILLGILSSQLMGPPQDDLGESLVLVLDGDVLFTDKGYIPSLTEAVAQGTPSSMPLRRLIEAIDRAGEDGRIDAILLLDGGPAVSGLAAEQQVHDALLRFQQRGKKLVAYANDFSLSTYWSASLADTVVMPPLGTFDFSGMGVELQYYARAMEKLGIEMQVTRVGRFKSAVEPFLLTEPSAAAREQWEVLLGDLQQEILEDIAAARGFSVPDLEILVQDPGLFQASEALELGFVDRAASFESVIEELTALVGFGSEGSDWDTSHSFAQVGLLRYLEDIENEVDEASYWIAVVYAEGEIVDGYDPDQIGGDGLAEQLRELRLGNWADAVVLRVNSPGGSASASEVILREMQLLREAEIPVVVSMGDLAASGGYWISCQADLIYAEPTTITGSIGVFGMFPNAAGLLDKLGIDVVSVQTSPRADMLSPARSKSEEELELMQGYVDLIYQGFLERVAVGRRLTVEEVDAIASGRVWSGRRAKELGLVDHLGSLNDAIQAAADFAGADHYEVDYGTVESSLMEDWVDALVAPEDYPVTKLPASLAAWQQLEQDLGLETFLRMRQNQGVQARMPYRFLLR